jgi:hypothetical protein
MEPVFEFAAQFDNAHVIVLVRRRNAGADDRPLSDHAKEFKKWRSNLGTVVYFGTMTSDFGTMTSSKYTC